MYNILNKVLKSFRNNIINILRFQTIILFLVSLAIFSIVYFRIPGILISLIILGYCSLISLSFYSQGERLEKVNLVPSKKIVKNYTIFLLFLFVLLSPIIYISFPKMILAEIYLNKTAKYLLYIILSVSLFTVLSAVSYIPAKITEGKNLKEAFREGLTPKFFEKGTIYNTATFLSLLILLFLNYIVSIPLFFLVISPILNIFYWEVYRM